LTIDNLGVIIYTPRYNRKEKMKDENGKYTQHTKAVDLNNIPENFVITYFAKKHNKIITRNGQWTKPDDFMTTGKAFISKNGVVCFIYWDCDAEPDEKGNQWRMAKNPMTIKATQTIEG